MDILILKTNIDTEQKFNYANYILKNFPEIKCWSLDKEDIDKVLRIEVLEGDIKLDIIKLLNKVNIHCEDLA